MIPSVGSPHFGRGAGSLDTGMRPLIGCATLETVDSFPLAPVMPGREVGGEGLRRAGPLKVNLQKDLEFGGISNH